MAMAVRMAVFVAMFLPVMRFVDVHLFHSTSFESETQPLGTAALLESMTTQARDFVDAPSHDCHYQKWQETIGNKQFTAGYRVAAPAEMTSPIAN